MKLTSKAAAAIGLVWLTACTDGLEPVPFQGISGVVRFASAPPDTTEWVRLAAYREPPATELALLSFAAISDTLPLAADSAGYVLGLEAGVYRWLPIIWKPAGVPLSPATLRVLGWYTGGGGPFDAPAAFLVEPGAERTGVDLIADFENSLTVGEALEALR